MDYASSFVFEEWFQLISLEHHQPERRAQLKAWLHDQQITSRTALLGMLGLRKFPDTILDLESDLREAIQLLNESKSRLIVV